MKRKEQQSNFMEKVAQFIVDKRNLFFLIYIAAMIFCAFSMNWKQVETDITVGCAQVAGLNRQMMDIMGYSVVLIIAALTLTSTAYLEVPVLLCEKRKKGAACEK